MNLILNSVDRNDVENISNHRIKVHLSFNVFDIVENTIKRHHVWCVQGVIISYWGVIFNHQRYWAMNYSNTSFTNNHNGMGLGTQEWIIILVAKKTEKTGTWKSAKLQAGKSANKPWEFKHRSIFWVLVRDFPSKSSQFKWMFGKTLSITQHIEISDGKCQAVRDVIGLSGTMTTKITMDESGSSYHTLVSGRAWGNW